MKRVDTRLIMRAKGLLVAGLIAVLGMGLVACSAQSPEEVIREGVTKELQQIKDLDQEALDEIVKGANTAGDLTEFGIETEEFCRAWLDGFDYTVDDVIVEDDEAVVQVTIKCKSLGTAMETWLGGLEGLHTQYENDRDGFNNAVGDSLMEALAQAELSESTAELPYVLNDNTWEPGPSFEAQLNAAFIGDYNF